MRSLDRLRRSWRALVAIALTLGAFALLWAARAAPFQPAPFVRVDALSAFFCFALSSGIALVAIAWPGVSTFSWRASAAVVLLLIAWNTTLTPIIVSAYLVLALLDRPPTTDHQPPTKRSPPNPQSSTPNSRLWAIRRELWVAPSLVAAGALLVGYGALVARGALRYDARTAGAALDSFVFWFVLLAAAIPVSVLVHSQSRGLRTEGRGLRAEYYGLQTTDYGQITHHASPVHPFTDIFRFAWLYPLVRLYSLGPWNTGWGFATLLLGGAAALWVALAALTRPADRPVLAPRCFLALALAGLGLGTGAGIAAACYGVLAYLVLVLPGVTTDHQMPGDTETGRQGDNGRRTTDDGHNTQHATHNIHWLLSGAIPLTAPFVAAWMLVGASVAGGVALLAGAAWLVVLLSGLTAALAGVETEGNRRALLIAAGVSMVIGIGAPLIVLALVQPVIEQLQGGLTPYGDVNIWPWVGLATIDAGHTPVTTLPSIAVAAFMLVLSALVYLIARLRGEWAQHAPANTAASDLGALLVSLRDEVPWLGALAPRPTDEERGVDGQ
jgi:hypothetical protein